MAKGLIPLMLSSPDATSSFSSRSSVMLKSPTRASYSPPVSPAHRRNQSDITPIIKLSRPPVRSSMKRSSQQLPASLPQIPYNSAEWKKAISEIKRYHVTRRYRACSARCNEILTNIKNVSMVEPAYLIYLNFYAAASLEMCARPLAPASAYRLNLLQQARAHYERAAALIRAAEDTAIVRTRCSSAASTLPSLHSPSNSVSSSRAWTPESGLTTPTTCCSMSRKSSLNVSGSNTMPKPHAKKKVSFELPRDKSRWSFTIPEPAIRPDSPTLGFDDEYFAAGAMRQELPELPVPAPVATSMASKRSSRQEIESYAQQFNSFHMPSISERDELPNFSPIDSATNTSTETPSTDAGDGDEYPFFIFPQRATTEAAHALSRYCETLAALKVQVASHTAALDEVIAEDLELQVRPESPILHDANSLVTAGLQRMSMQHSRGASQSWRGSVVVSGRHTSRNYTSSSSPGLSVVGEEEDSEEKVRERKARIDRLKMSGWRRQRFDASRYEDLCDVVMAELNHD